MRTGFEREQMPAHNGLSRRSFVHSIIHPRGLGRDVSCPLNSCLKWARSRQQRHVT